MKANIYPSYDAKVMEVISGDDLIVMVELGIDDLFKRVRARLRGVDTPDAYKKSEGEAGEIRADVRRLTKGKKCRVDVHSQGRGGWVVTLFIVGDAGELDLNEYLRGRGFVYTPRERSDAEAQTQAS